jgi:hypothetical protein
VVKPSVPEKWEGDMFRKLVKGIEKMPMQVGGDTSSHNMFRRREEREAREVYLGLVQRMREAQITEDESIDVMHGLICSISMGTAYVHQTLRDGDITAVTWLKGDTSEKHEIIWKLNLSALVLNHVLSLQLNTEEKLRLLRCAGSIVTDLKSLARDMEIDYKKIREIMRAGKNIIDDRQHHRTKESEKWKRDLQNIRQLSPVVSHYENYHKGHLSELSDLHKYSRECDAADISGIDLVVRALKVSSTVRSTTLSQKPLKRMDAPSSPCVQSGSRRMNYTRWELIREIHRMNAQLCFEPQNEHFGDSQAKIVNKCAHILYDVRNLPDELKELIHHIALTALDVFMSHEETYLGDNSFYSKSLEEKYLDRNIHPETLLYFARQIHNDSYNFVGVKSACTTDIDGLNQKDMRAVLLNRIMGCINRNGNEHQRWDLEKHVEELDMRELEEKLRDVKNREKSLHNSEKHAIMAVTQIMTEMPGVKGDEIVSAFEQLKGIAYVCATQKMEESKNKNLTSENMAKIIHRFIQLWAFQQSQNVLDETEVFSALLTIAYRLREAENIEANKELTIIDYEVIIKAIKAGHRPGIEGMSGEETIEGILNFAYDSKNPNLTRAQKEMLREDCGGLVRGEGRHVTRVVLTQDDICRLSQYHCDELLQIRNSIEDSLRIDEEEPNSTSLRDWKAEDRIRAVVDNFTALCDGFVRMPGAVILKALENLCEAQITYLCHHFIAYKNIEKYRDQYIKELCSRRKEYSYAEGIIMGHYLLKKVERNSKRSFCGLPSLYLIYE